VSSVSHHYYCR